MNWISELNAGDKVIVHSRYHDLVKTVDKVTPTGRIKIGETYFSKDGREMGSDVWSSSCLREATEEAVTAITHADTIREALYAAHSAKDLSYEQAVKILDVLKPE